MWQGPANIEAICRLAELGAKVAAVTEQSMLESPLHIAARCGRQDIVKRLLACNLPILSRTKVILDAAPLQSLFFIPYLACTALSGHCRPSTGASLSICCTTEGRDYGVCRTEALLYITLLPLARLGSSELWCSLAALLMPQMMPKILPYTLQQVSPSLLHSLCPRFHADSLPVTPADQGMTADRQMGVLYRLRLH